MTKQESLAEADSQDELTVQGDEPRTDSATESVAQTQAVTQEVTNEETSTPADTSADVEEEATPTDEAQDGQSEPSDDESDAQEADDEADDDEALVPLSKLKKVRSEAKSLRERLRDAEGKITELQQESSKYDELLNTVRQERLSALLTSELATAVEPAAALNLIKADDVTWEDNQPTNVNELVQNLKTAYPKLFNSFHGTTNAGARDEEVDYNRLDLTPEQLIAAGYKNSSR